MTTGTIPQQAPRGPNTKRKRWTAFEAIKYMPEFNELHPDVSLAAWAVAIALATHWSAKRGLGIFPSIPTLAKIAHADERTVSRALRELEADGAISREKFGRGYKYRLHWIPESARQSAA